MKNPNQIIPSLTDEQLKEAIFECLEDEERNDGIIHSKWHRKLAKQWAELTGSPSFQFLTLISLLLYKEGCNRFITKTQKQNE
jgi:hypothetical protein